MKSLKSLFVSAVALFALLAGSAYMAGPAGTVSAQDETETYQVDRVHSSVLFRVKHANSSLFFGRFIDLSGSIKLNRANPSASSVDLTVQAESVRTFSQKRDNHLRSPDFLNAKQYPTITFESTSVEAVKDKENRFRVTGDFTLHGTTKEITIEVEKTGEGKGPQGNPRIGFYSTFTINRTEYGMTKYADSGMIGNEVKIYISVEGVNK